MSTVKPNHYVGKVVEDESGELCVEFPIDMLNQMGWDEGTLIEWIVDEEKVMIKEANEE
jgi:hypothetical protein